MDAAHAQGHDTTAATATAPTAPTLDSASREIAEVVFSPQAGNFNGRALPKRREKMGVHIFFCVH